MRGILIPSEPTSPIRDIEIDAKPNEYSKVAKLLGELVGGWIEIVNTHTLEATLEGFDWARQHNGLAMVVNEDYHSAGITAINHRAWLLYPDLRNPIMGEAVILAEDRSDRMEGPFCVSLPELYTSKFLQGRLDRITQR